MHGLVNRSIQCFLRDSFGAEVWAGVARRAELPGTGFEAMLSYEDALTFAVIDAAALRLNRPREALLEDLGTYLVSSPSVAAVRRLLRFGGASFADFLHSLDELPERARLAVPDLILPALEVELLGEGRFRLTCGSGIPGFGILMLGVLRAMADDYGALACFEHVMTGDGAEVVLIELIEARFADGRQFELAAG